MNSTSTPTSKRVFSTSRLFDDATTADVHKREYKRIASACEDNELPFSEAQCRRAAWKSVAERLHSLAAQRYHFFMQAELPAYVRYDDWWLDASIDFMRASRVEEFSCYGQRRFRLVITSKEAV